jgi:hypothetical protein
VLIRIPRGLIPAATKTIAQVEIEGWRVTIEKYREWKEREQERTRQNQEIMRRFERDLQRERIQMDILSMDIARDQDREIPLATNIRRWEDD